MAKCTRSELEIERYKDQGDLPDEKQVHFNEEIPRRTESRARSKLPLRVVSPRLKPMRQVKDSPTRCAIKQGMTVLKFVTSPKPSGRNRQKQKDASEKQHCTKWMRRRITPGMLP